MQSAVEVELGVMPAKRRRLGRPAANQRIQGTAEQRMRQWRQRCWRLRRQLQATRKELARHTAAKQAGGRIAEEWIARVITCAPHISARGLVSALHLAAGTDCTVACRSSVGAVRAAWLEMYQTMVLAACRRR